MIPVIPKVAAQPPQFFKLVTTCAVTIAVIGVATSILFGNMFFAVGYAILGVSTYATWCWGSVNVEQLRTLQTKMEADLHTLEQKTAEIEHLKDQFETNRKQVEKDRQLLQTQVTNLEKEEATLKKDVVQFQTAAKLLQQEIKGLNDEKSALETKLQNFVTTISNLTSTEEKTDEVINEELSKEDLLLQRLATFSANAASQKQQNDALIQQIHLFQKSEDALTQEIKSCNERLKTVADLNELNVKVQQRTEQLNKLESAIENKIEQLKKLQAAQREIAH